MDCPVSRKRDLSDFSAIQIRLEERNIGIVGNTASHLVVNSVSRSPAFKEVCVDEIRF